MIRFIVALLLVQAFRCAEFPDLEKHIKLVWNKTDLTGHFDGSQTVSDKDGNVTQFILCGAFNNSADNGDCSLSYSYSEQSETGAIFSASGSGSCKAKFVSNVNETYSCLSFLNMVGDFRSVYASTLKQRGSWKMSYSCQKEELQPEIPVPWGKIISVIFILLMVVVGIGMCFFKCVKKIRQKKTPENALLLT